MTEQARPGWLKGGGSGCFGWDWGYYDHTQLYSPPRSRNTGRGPPMSTSHAFPPPPSPDLMKKAACGSASIVLCDLLLGSSDVAFRKPVTAVMRSYGCSGKPLAVKKHLMKLLAGENLFHGLQIPDVLYSRPISTRPYSSCPQINGGLPIRIRMGTTSQEMDRSCAAQDAFLLAAEHNYQSYFTCLSTRPSTEHFVTLNAAVTFSV